MMSGEQIRRLASAGVAAVGLRQMAIRAIGLGGTVVLARLLTPRDFGAVAFGTALVMVFGFAADAGIGAGLIRGRHVPEREDLGAFLGLQVAISLVCVALTAIVALPLGQVGRVTTLMVLSIPIAAFRSPAVVVFERDLRYQRLVLVELAETVVFYCWAIATVLIGWGVWGLASATPVRATFGALLLNILSPAGFVRPLLSWKRVRNLLGFGVQYQAVAAVGLIRDQGLNVGIAAIAGVAVLGLWSLAYRILQLPFLLFDSVWRVSFPAMSRLIAAGEDTAPLINRGLALAGVVTGGMLCVLVGSTPSLIPSVFGHQWVEAGGIVPWAALGLMFAGPVSVATAGYLYAIGDSTSVLVSAALHTLAWLAVALPLLHVLGVRAVGLGWLVASIVEAAVLARSTRQHIPIEVMSALAMPAALASIGALAGWMTSTSLGPTFVSAVAGAVVAGALYLAGILALRRRALFDTLLLTRRAVMALVR